MAKSIWPNDDSTTALLAAAKGGNRDAINDLLEKHRVPLRRLVQLRLDRKVQRRVDISDVVQEVMMEATGRLDKYLGDPSMAFHLWLRQIAWDHIIDTYRRHRVSAKRNMDREQPMMAAAGTDQSTMELVVQLCDPALTPAALATQKEIAEKVEIAVELLGDQDREIITMRHYEHLSNLEIAEALGLNAAAASMRYLRAIRRLREVLAEQGEVSFDGESRA